VSTPELHQQAADPTTDLATLAALAHEHADLRPVIALNPSAYDGLLDWMSQLGDPAVNAALAQRTGQVAGPTAGWEWREPNRSVVLRWGNYPLRYGLALGLVLTALLFPFFLVAPTGYLGLGIIAALTIAAAAVMPAPPARRVVAGSLVVAFVLMVVLANMSIQYLLPDFIYGIYRFVPFETAISLIIWLVLRQRSGLAYLLLPLAYLELVWQQHLFEVVRDGLFNLGLAGEGLQFRELLYSVTSYVTVLIHAAFLVGLAWLARLISVARGAAQHTGPERQATLAMNRDTVQHEARVAQIKQWEAAYRDAHNGAEPPPGFSPPVAVASSGTTNTMAILALIFGFGGGLLGIVFGHVARAQIRRTGEGGWALATIGLVLGYIGLAGWVVVIGLYLWFFVLLLG